MTGIYLEDNTSIHFVQDNYNIHFEGMTVTFLLKEEFARPRRESKIVVDYSDKTAYFEWADGHNETLKFKGLI
jgi:hypothetical protein